jgi:hypothetical protein
MIQRPTAVGLILCQQVIVEEQTRNMTLVNSFGRLRVDAFPSPPQRFTVHAILTDGLGRITLSLVIARLDTLEAVYTRSWKTAWTNPWREIRLLMRVNSCSFPVAGPYQVSLLANDELVTQGTFNVLQQEENS